ncbi:Thylakoid lumenal 15 kDa protein 1, chloroplastic [Porphyridium purpureum]|uniref:Thylakoid lumenal 15 kDa protein 1, chloroplastic n=1 Tax=Porphyridium purpureum TaxID=35688 RepID=A0A5J4YM78_PORPP|nr:Thylakoid lumenal 15 kDa protein 1, chloroplastic [Porphyridium purpureum]|eukprot:POR7366..scf295_9
MDTKGYTGNLYTGVIYIQDKYSQACELFAAFFLEEPDEAIAFIKTFFAEDDKLSLWPTPNSTMVETTIRIVAQTVQRDVQRVFHDELALQPAHFFQHRSHSANTGSQCTCGTAGWEISRGCACGTQTTEQAHELLARSAACGRRSARDTVPRRAMAPLAFSGGTWSFVGVRTAGKHHPAGRCGRRATGAVAPLAMQTHGAVSVNECRRAVMKWAAASAVAAVVIAGNALSVGAEEGYAVGADKVSGGAASTLNSGTVKNVTRGVDLSGASFKGKNMRGQSFQQSILRDVDFSGANLTGASFFDADLAFANFEGAVMDNANLELANLRGANLKDAVVTSAYIVGSTKIGDVKIENADFTDTFFRKDQQRYLCSIASGTNPTTGNATRDTLMCP